MRWCCRRAPLGGVVDASINGGLTLDWCYNLNDDDDDGKIRGLELEYLDDLYSLYLEGSFKAFISVSFLWGIGPSFELSLVDLRWHIKTLEQAPSKLARYEDGRLILEPTSRP